MSKREITMKKMPPNSNIFIFDIDGTICNLDKSFIDTAYALSMLDGIDEETINSRCYIRLSDCGFITESDEAKVIKLFDVFHVWENLDIIPFSNDFIRKITEKGCYLIYLTARPDYLRSQTIKWLKSNGFPSPSNEDANMNERTTLVMRNKYSEKEENLLTVLNFHVNNNLFYFENDPLLIKKISDNKIKCIYTFENNFTHSHSFNSNVVKIKSYNDIDVEKLLKK